MSHFLSGHPRLRLCSLGSDCGTKSNLVMWVGHQLGISNDITEASTYSKGPYRVDSDRARISSYLSASIFDWTVTNAKSIDWLSAMLLSPSSVTLLDHKHEIIFNESKKIFRHDPSGISFYHILEGQQEAVAIQDFYNSNLSIIQSKTEYLLSQTVESLHSIHAIFYVRLPALDASSLYIESIEKLLSIDCVRSRIVLVVPSCEPRYVECSCNGKLLKLFCSPSEFASYGQPSAWAHLIEESIRFFYSNGGGI